MRWHSSLKFAIQQKQLSGCVRSFSVFLYPQEKMQAAGLMPPHSGNAAVDIAGRFGCDNGSGFAAAMKALIGRTPKEYRSAGDSTTQNQKRMKSMYDDK